MNDITRIGVRLLLGIIRMFKSTENIYYIWTIKVIIYFNTHNHIYLWCTHHRTIVIFVLY